MPGFDFQSLAARAHADNPDAELFDLIEADKGHRRRFGRAQRVAFSGDRDRGEALVRQAILDGSADRERLRALRPATLDGLLAKLRYFAAKAEKAPISADYHAALADAIAWLEPPKLKRGRGAGRKRAGAQP
jgi:hypothetical protein